MVGSIDPANVVSDERFYDPFLCRSCHQLVTLDAIVTTECSHIFCRKCLENEWDPRTCGCPFCQRNLSSRSRTGSMILEDAQILAQPLVDAQPLAYAVLRRIEVRCSKTPSCQWTGDYKSYFEHCEGPAHRQVVSRRHSMTGSQPPLTSRRPRRFSGTVGSGQHIRDLMQSDSQLLQSSDHLVAKEQQSQVFLKVVQIKAKANSRFKVSDYDGAIKLYTEAITLLKVESATSKEDKVLQATLFCSRATASLKLYDFQTCLDDCDEAIRLNPENYKAYLRRSRALMSIGQLEDACSLLNTGIATVSNKDSLIEELRKMQELMDHLTEVKGFLAQNDVSAAAGALAPIMSFPENACTSLMAAWVDAARGKTDRALDQCAKAFKLVPGHVAGLLVVGYVTILCGEIKEGIEMLAKSLQENPNDADTKSMLLLARQTRKAIVSAREVAEAGESDKAVEYYTEALEGGLYIPQGTPLSIKLLMERGEELLSNGQYREAFLDADHVLDAEGENVRAWIIKAESYHGLGRSRDALRELQAIKSTWGSNNAEIEKACEKASFETKIQDAEAELVALIPSGKKENQEEEVDIELMAAPEERPMRRLRRSSMGHSQKRLQAY